MKKRLSVAGRRRGLGAVHRLRGQTGAGILVHPARSEYRARPFDPLHGEGARASRPAVVGRPTAGGRHQQPLGCEDPGRGGVNLVSVYYRPMDADGKTLAGFWLPTEEMYQRTMDHAAADIALSDELGIQVMGYTDTVQFDDALMKEAYGYTLEDLAVRQADGTYAFTKAWDPEGCYVACINKPKWRALLADINALTAKAGFSCLMYDYYPYMAGGYFCHCSECESLWKAYSREKLGESKPMPAMFEFPDPVSIAYYKFRMESFASFMKETSAKAQTMNRHSPCCKITI